MKPLRYRCALIVALLFGLIAWTQDAIADSSFRNGLKSAIGDVAGLIKTDVNKNGSRREIRELDAALQDLLKVFEHQGNGHGHLHKGMHHHHHRHHHHHHNDFMGKEGQSSDRKQGQSSVKNGLTQTKSTGKKSAPSVTATSQATGKQANAAATAKQGPKNGVTAASTRSASSNQKAAAVKTTTGATGQLNAVGCQQVNAQPAQHPGHLVGGKALQKQDHTKNQRVAAKAQPTQQAVAKNVTNNPILPHFRAGNESTIQTSIQLNGSGKQVSKNAQPKINPVNLVGNRTGTKQTARNSATNRSLTGSQAAAKHAPSNVNAGRKK
jgi:hypothetical protein